MIFLFNIYISAYLFEFEFFGERSELKNNERKLNIRKAF